MNCLKNSQLGAGIEPWGSDGQQGAQGWKSNGAQVVTVNASTALGRRRRRRAAKENATQEKTKWVVTGEGEDWERFRKEWSASVAGRR